MVRKITLFTVMAFLSLPFFAQREQNLEEGLPSVPAGYAESSRVSLKSIPLGNPLEVTEYNGPSFDKLVRTKTIIYDGGRISSEKIFTAEGNLSSGVEYVYSSGDVLTEIRGLDVDGNIKWAYRYEYDDIKRLVKESSFNIHNGNEVLEGCVTLVYDSNGLVSKRETFSADDVMTLREVFTYNEAGKLVEAASYYGDETLLKRTVYEYASGKGLVLQIRSYDVNGLYETTKYEYQQDGKISSILRYGYDSVLKDTETRVYCEDKIVRRVVTNADGSPSSASFCLYDWMGNGVFERSQEGITVREFVYPE